MTNRDRFISAAAVTAGVFVLYLVTLSPSAAMWDAGEYIAAAKSLGIPHQPGNPMFVLIAHVAGMVPVSADYAVRINVLAALASAVTAGLWFLCAERMLRASITDTATRLGASVLAAGLGATAFTVWNQSVVMEKVYPLSLVGLALVSWLVLRWFDASAQRGDRLLVLVAYLTGLSYAVHPAGVLTAPAIAIAVLMQRPRTLLRWKLLGVLAGAFVFGASSFAVLPIRAAHQPFINESAVSACEGGTIGLSCTFSAETARRLVGTIQREQYGGNPVAVRRAPIEAQVAQFWMYFKWQWLRDSGGRMPVAQSVIAALMLVLGLVGLAALRRSDDAASAASRPPGQAPWFWYFAPLAVTFTVVLIYYLNFRYSSGQSPELGNLVDREPRERDYFYMWTFSLWGLFAGIGLSSLVLGSRHSALGIRRSALGRVPRAALLTAFALVPLIANWSPASRSGQSFTREWAADMLSSVEPNGVLITNGDNDSFPLWYAQEVEGIRRDVTVTLVPYLAAEWYARQLNRRAGLWKLSDHELDTIPSALENPLAMQFTHGAITASIPPGFLTRDQLLVLRAIKDSFPARPIYFSFGPYAQRLGLQEYVKRVGLVQKLEPRPVREDPDTIRLENGSYVDIPRSLALWKSYGAPHQVIREGKWVDAASSDIPVFYAMVGQDLAIALDARGQRAQAEEVIGLARMVVDAVR